MWSTKSEKKLIKEVLDNDKNANRRPAFAQRKNAQKNEVGLLHAKMSPKELQKLGLRVSSLLKVLEYKDHAAKLRLPRGTEATPLGKHIDNVQCGRCDFHVWLYF